MADFKVIPCTSKPFQEFLLDENRPDHIGTRTSNIEGRAWFTRKQVEKLIQKMERDLEFWKELEGLFPAG